MKNKQAKKVRNYSVTKQNGLDIVSNKKNEMRLFAVYLCRIDKERPETRRVKFTLRDFERICGVANQQSKKYYIKLAEEMLKKLMRMPCEGGIRINQIFSECFIGFDGNGYTEENVEYFIFDAHDKALDMLFEYQNRFFSYKLYNLLELSGENQVRLYEMLKEIMGVKKWQTGKTKPQKWAKPSEVSEIISISELKERLQIDKAYPLLHEFKRRVLDPCRDEINKKTDIEFDYEPIKVNRKTEKIRFTIREKIGFKDPLADLFDNEEAISTGIEVGLSRVGKSLGTNPGNAKETVIQMLAERGEQTKTALKEMCGSKFTLQQTLSLYEELKLYAPHYADDDAKLLQGVRIAVTRTFAYRARNLFPYARKVIQSFGVESKPIAKERKKSPLYTQKHERLERLYNQIQVDPDNKELRKEFNNAYHDVYGH